MTLALEECFCLLPTVPILVTTIDSIARDESETDVALEKEPTETSSAGDDSEILLPCLECILLGNVL